MLRNAARAYILSRHKNLIFNNGGGRYQSTSRQSQGIGIEKIYIAGGVAVTFGGLFGYAAWSTENQRGLQNAIPGSKYILEPILGAVAEPVKPSQKVAPSIDSGLLKKKLDRDKEKEFHKIKDKEVHKKDDAPAKPPETEPVKDSSVTVPPLPTPPPPPLPEPSSTLPSTSDSSVKDDIKDIPAVEEKLEPSKPTEAIVEVELSPNETLSKNLRDNMSIAHKSVQSALKTAETVAEKVHKFAEAAYTHVDTDEGEEKLLAIASDISKVKNELIRSVEERLNVAKNAQANLQKECSSGLDSDETKTNPDLQTAKDKITELAYTMNRISSIVAEALREANALSEFRDMVLESRKQFESELQSISQGTKGKEEQLQAEELKSQLSHAHRKVLVLQRHLAKEQTMNKGRFKESTARYRDQEARHFEGRIQAELERQKHELGMEYRRRMQQIKEDNENELRLQLKRQAAAHSDHLSDMLHLQEQQLEHKWHNKMEDELQREKDEYHKSLSKINGHISGLKAAMKKRADVDKAAHEAHELWMACQSLKSALRVGKELAKSWEEQLLPLQERIDAVKIAAGESNPFAEAVLSSIPDLARQRGVFTEDALRERFIKVERICKRVSMIGDNGGSLLRYLLSYLQSFLIINAFEQLPGKEVRNQEIDLSTLNTYDLLARAKYCLEKDDLLQAIRYMNFLSGEPKHVAKDWVLEARLTLEAGLAADALLAHAAATGARAL